MHNRLIHVHCTFRNTLCHTKLMWSSMLILYKYMCSMCVYINMYMYIDVQ